MAVMVSDFKQDLTLVKQATVLRLEAQRLRQEAQKLDQAETALLKRSMGLADGFTGDPEMIVTAVAGAYRTEVCRLKSKLRDEHTALARAVAMYLMREMTPYSFPLIGSYFNRDHSTVISAYHKVQNLIKLRPEFKATLKKIEKAVLDAQL